jgi:hypothetical protein
MISAKCTKTVIGGLSLLLVLSGCSSGSKQRAADPTPPAGTGKTVAVDDKTVTQRPAVDDKTVTQRPMDAAVSHAWKAEAAGDAGNIPQMLHHTRLALEQATFAQRKRMEPRTQQDLGKQDLAIDPECRAEFEKLFATLCQGIEPGSGRLRKCYEDNESALTPSCRQQVGARKSEAAAMLVTPKKEGELATPKKEGELATPKKEGAPVIEHKRVLPSETYVAGFGGGYLNSGIQDLKETLVVGTRDGIAASALRDARRKLVRASTADTVRGELGRNERPTAGGAAGGERYIVRDFQNYEMPIALSPEMSQQVHVGDMVEAQIDSDGQVTSITKADTKADTKAE